MYQPPAFREDRIEVQHQLIRAHPLGLLITAGPAGLIANPLPFLIDPSGSEKGSLRVHLARANPQWRELEAVEECLVVFQGPQDYVTPSWYATKRETGKVVPTWNYVAIHARGPVTFFNDTERLLQVVTRLTDREEGKRAAPWAVTDAPADFIDGMLKGIVGFSLPITRLEGKWKMSQNRPAEDRAGVVDGLTAGGRDVVAELVRESNKG
jgi:transcriptional regulator